MHNLTQIQAQLAEAIVKVFSIFGIPADSKLAGVLDYLVRTEHASGPDNLELRKQDALAQGVDEMTAETVLMAFGIAGVPVCHDTFVALDYVSDQIRHKIVDTPIGRLAPGSNLVN